MKGYLIIGNSTYYDDSSYTNSLGNGITHLNKEKAEKELREITYEQIQENLEDFPLDNDYWCPVYLHNLIPEEVEKLKLIEEIQVTSHPKNPNIYQLENVQEEDGYTNKRIKEEDLEFIYEILDKEGLLPYRIDEIHIEE